MKNKKIYYFNPNINPNFANNELIIKFIIGFDEDNFLGLYKGFNED